MYLGVALALLAPVASAPATLAIGHPETDTFNHVWGYWHTRAALLTLVSPFRGLGLSWPSGGALWFIDQLGATLTLPVNLAGGPVLAYNLWLLLHLVGAGLATFALGRRLALSVPAAALAGLAFETTPHLLGQLYNGISETATVGTLPLCLVAALRMREAPGLRRGGELGLALSLSALGSWYYGLFSALGVAGLILRDAWRTPRRWARPAAWGGLLAAGATLLTLVGPPFLLFRQTLMAPGALVRRDESFVALTLAGHNQVDLWSFFRPGRTYSPDLRALYDEALITVVYAGWTLLVAGAIALWRGRDHGPARALAAVALVCFVLAQGPWLYVSGSWVALPGGEPTPLPFLVLTQLVPGFASMSHAFRFAVPMGLALSLLAGLAVDAAPRGRAAIAGALGLTWAIELLIASPAVLPLPVSRVEAPACYAALTYTADWAPLPRDGAVLDLPVSLQVLARGRYAGWQTRHGLGIPYGLNDPTPAALKDNRLALAIIGLERSSVDTVGSTLPALDLALGARDLGNRGYKAIAVHGDLYPPEVRARVLELLRIVLGEGRTIEDCTLFALPGPGAAAL